MKKKIASLMMFVMVCFGFITIASAQEMNEMNKTEVTEEVIVPSPRADIIERKYRIHNGIEQYRRWNRTQGYWVDPYWINI